MLKWVGRLLYVVIVFLFISTVGLGDGIVLSEYYENVVLEESNTVEETISTYLGMDHSYYQKESLLDSPVTATSNKNEIEVGFSLDIYPLGSSKTNIGDNVVFDGLVLSMSNITNSDNFHLSHFSIQLQVRNGITGDISDIYLADDNYYVYAIIPPSNSEIKGTPKGIAFITEVSMKNVDPKQPAIAEYEILTMAIFAHGHLLEDETMKDQNIHVFTGYKDGHSIGNPAVVDNNFVLDRDEYLLSEITGITDVPTESEINTYNLGYITPDYSPYNYWYWVIGFMYFALIIIIPYFWFVHHKVMETYRTKKRIKLLAEQKRLEREKSANDVSSQAAKRSSRKEENETVEAEFIDRD